MKPRIGNCATRIVQIGNRIDLYYHATCVASLDLNTKIVTLNSGGYRTATTKQRMNEFARAYNLGYKVYQVKGVWGVMDTSLYYDPNTEDRLFFDGIKIHC